MSEAENKQMKGKAVDLSIRLTNLLSSLEEFLGVAYKVYLSNEAEKIMCLAIERSRENDFIVSLANGEASAVFIQELTYCGVWQDDNGEDVDPREHGIMPRLAEVIEGIIEGAE